MSGIKEPLLNGMRGKQVYNDNGSDYSGGPTEANSRLNRN